MLRSVEVPVCQVVLHYAEGTGVRSVIVSGCLKFNQMEERLER